MVKELDQMFSDYEKRNQNEKEAKEDKAAKHRAFRDEAIKIINEKIAHVLNEISEDLKTRGHESNVSLFIDNQSYPSARMTFRIVSKEPYDYKSESKLSFSTTSTEDKMEARSEIFSKNGKVDSHSYGGNNIKLLADVTPEWVRDQTLSFVSSVLKNQ